MNTFCEYFDQHLCRSCSLLPITYTDQVSQKESILLKKLNIDQSLLLPTITSNLLGFRNKVKLAVGLKGEDITFGLVDKNFNTVDLSQCPVQNPVINEMLPLIKEFITTTKLSVYDPRTSNGELKYIIIYYNPHSNESYLRLVLRSKEAHSRLIKHLSFIQDRINHLKIISINIQPSPHPILEGEEEIVLSSQTHLNHTLHNINFKLSPQGFVQTNLEVSTSLYQQAALWIKELNGDKFLELFSGQGAFSFFAAQNVRSALGIEINQSAVDSANLSAQKLGLNHLSFKCLDASHIKEELNQFSPDIILANPPRRGLAESLDLINHSGATYFIYSSCNYETLSSDLSALSHYKIEKAQIFDMFAHTEHFETLVLLKKIVVELPDV